MLKVAVIGIGVIGQVHLSVLKANGIIPVAVCDIDCEKAEECLKKMGISCPVWGDFKEMLKEAHPDAVEICTPHYLHAEMITECLSFGCNVLCEKPLCIKVEDIDRILAAEKASGKVLAVCHQNRTNPANQFVKEYLADKKVLTAHGSVVWHRDAAYYGSADWRGKWETEGGGVLINQALHTLDLMGWLFGQPESVCGSVANLTLQGEIEVEDTAFARFDGKVPFTFSATNAGGADLPVEITCKLQGGQVLTLLPHTVLLDGTPIFVEQKLDFNGKCCYGFGHGRMIPDFLKAAENGGKSPLEASDAAGVIRMIAGIYKSNGKKISI